MLTPEQKDVVRFAWEVDQTHHRGSFFTYAREFIKDPDWGRAEIMPIVLDGEFYGGFYFAGPEVHAYLKKPVMFRRFLRIIDQKVKEWGYCDTFTARDNLPTLKTLLRLGFVPILENEEAYQLRLTEPLYE